MHIAIELFISIKKLNNDVCLAVIVGFSLQNNHSMRLKRCNFGSDDSLITWASQITTLQDILQVGGVVGCVLTCGITSSVTCEYSTTNVSNKVVCLLFPGTAPTATPPAVISYNVFVKNMTCI